MMRRALVAGTALGALAVGWRDIRVHCSGESRDAVGRTPLMLAILRQDKAQIGELLGRSDVNATDSNRLPPLTYAAWRGDADTVAALMDGGANVFHLDDFGVHALLKAVGFKHHRVARLILEREPAVVNLKQGPIRAPASYGAVSLMDAPLHVAARKGDTPMCKLLLAFGADVRAGNVHNDTPLDIAVKSAPGALASLKMPDANERTLLQRLGLRSAVQNKEQVELVARSSSWGTLSVLLDASGGAAAIDGAALRQARPSVRWALRLGLVRAIADARNATGLEM